MKVRKAGCFINLVIFFGLSIFLTGLYFLNIRYITISYGTEKAIKQEIKQIEESKNQNGPLAIAKGVITDIPKIPIFKKEFYTQFNADGKTKPETKGETQYNFAGIQNFPEFFDISKLSDETKKYVDSSKQQIGKLSDFQRSIEDFGKKGHDMYSYASSQIKKEIKYVETIGQHIQSLKKDLENKEKKGVN